MKSKITSTGLWIKATAVFIMLPVYLLILFGTIKIFGRFGEYKTFLGILPGAILLAILVSAFFLIRSGKLALPLIIVTIVLISAIMFGEMGGFKPDPGGKTVWTIEGDLRIPNIDVYCNDVHLGQTPLKITEKEFYAKVKPWDTPPRQERTTLREDDYDDDNRFGWADYTWIPSNFIEYTKRWPGEEMQRPLWGRIPKDEEFFAFCKKTPYWWRFEKDGCSGLAGFESLLSWGGSGGPGGAELSSGSSVEFPSLDKHFQVCVAALKRNNWQLTEAWMKHFAEYKDLLFGKLYEYTRQHAQARPVLDAVVRQEMNIPSGELSEAQRRDVMDNVLRRAEKQSEFRVPSFESEAALLACKDRPEMISEYYRKALGYGRGGRVSSSDNFIRYGNPGPAIRLPVMRWIVSQYKPAQLYNQLVYTVGGSASIDHWIGVTDLKLVLNYPRPESEKILDYYLKSRQNGKSGPFGRASDNEDIIRFLTSIHNPLLEQQIRTFVQNNPGRANFDHETQQFVESRVKQYPKDPELPGWILHYTQLRDDEKVQMIARLKTKSINSVLSYLCTRNPRLREQALRAIKGNPFGDEFVINCYRYCSVHDEQYMMYVIRAIVTMDTPAIREFISETWNKDKDSRTFLLKYLRYSWEQPHVNMDWMLPMLAELNETEERIMAVHVLVNIDTPKAKALMTDWSNGADPKVAREAKSRLGQFSSGSNNKAESVIAPETIDGVLSGRIKPDDLLPPATAYVWNGEKYVPEKQ